MSLLTRLLAIAKTSVVTVQKVIYEWGGAAAGQLGQNNIIDKSTPVQVGTSNWTSIAAGNSFTVAVKSDGTLWAWGVNNSYQLGQGDTVNRSSPVQIYAGGSSYSNWAQVSAGASHAAAITNAGELYTWGNDTYGQVGKPTSWISATFSGTQYNIAAMQLLRSDGTVWTSGTTYQGLNGTGTDSSVPTLAKAKEFVKVVSGWQSTTYALDSTGALWGWGTGTALSSQAYPVLISVGPYKDISVGENHLLLIDGNNQLYARGTNTYGQLGTNNTTTNNSTFVKCDTNDNWVSVSAGSATSFAINTQGQLFAWGYNGYGDLGTNNRTHKSSPTQIGTGISFVMISAGHSQAAIAIDGSLWTWGNNMIPGVGTLSGELGTNDAVQNRSVPIQIGTSSWAMVSSGLASKAGITVDGKLFTWGAYALGDNPANTRSSPVQIGNTSYYYTHTDMGRGTPSFACIGRDVNGNVILQVTGSNYVGQLGIGGPLSTTYSTLMTVGVGTGSGYPPIFPSRVGTSSWTQVAAGGFHTLATNTSNKLFGWGRNDFYQTGSGDRINKSSPTQVSSLSSVSIIQVSAGELHSHAIASDGKLYGWGRNENSEVGYVRRKWKQVTSYANFGMAGLDETGVLWVWGINDAAQGTNDPNTARSSPTQVYANKRFTDIYGTSGNMFALDFDKKLWGWGTNTNSNLGIYNGELASISYPIQIMTDISWNMVGCGLRYGAGIDSNGILRAWGVGVTNGQSTSLDRSSPAQIASGTYTSVSVGYTHAAAIKSDGTLWVWGYNTNGALGTNDRVNRSSPVQVGTDTNWSAVLAGSASTYALKTDGSVWSWGFNTSSQLGRAGTANQSAPAQIALDTTSVSNYFTRYGTSTPSFIGTISTMGQNNTQCFEIVDSNNNVWVAGNYGASTMGVFPWQTTTASLLKLLYSYGAPSTVLGPMTKTKAVLHGNGTGTALYNALIDVDGTMEIFGYNSAGQLGIPGWPIGSTGIAQVRSSPVQTGSGNQPVVAVPTVLEAPVAFSYNQVSSGRSTTVAVKTDGTVWSWGSNTSGKQGRSDNKVEYVAAAYYGMAAVMTDNRVYYAGSTTSAVGISINTSSPTQVLSHGGVTANLASDYWLSLPKSVPGDKRKSIQLGFIGAHLDHLGRAWAWGGGTSNNLAARGLGTVVANYIGAPKLTLNDYWPITKLTQKGASTFFLSGTTLYGVGARTQGQLGDNSTTGAASLPVVVSTDVADFWQPGANNLIYKKTDNSFWYTGVDATGWTAFTSTGYPYVFNPIYYRSSPTQIMSGAQGSAYSQIVSDALGSYVGMALKPDKTLWSWGTDYYGCMGFSNVSVIRTSPTFLMSDVEECVPAVNGFIVRKTDNTVWAWGDNQNGQFGDGTTISRSSPVQLFAGGRSSFAQIDAGTRSTYLVDFDGTLWVAGNNAQGQLGLNDLVSRTTFTAINFPATTSPTYLFNTSSKSFNQVSTNGNSTVAIRNDNTLWAWGENTNGQLGTNNTVSYSSPVQVTSINNTTGTFTQVSSGYNHTALVFTQN